MACALSYRTHVAEAASPRIAGVRLCIPGFILALILILAMTLGCSEPAWSLMGGMRIGDSPAYDMLGEMPVKHRGRRKPLVVAAQSEVRLVHGRPAITVTGPSGRKTWVAVAAVLDWSARPEAWQDRCFILVESADLRRLVSSADDSGTWVSPRRLEDARIDLGGRTVAFSRWVDELRDRRAQAGLRKAGPAWAPTPMEVEALVVGERLRRYQALSDHHGPAVSTLDLMPIPRPSHRIYRQYIAHAFQKGMDPDRALSPLEADAAGALVEYLERLPEREWAVPGEDPVFDQKFEAWLSQSAWLSAGMVLECDESELSRAGLPPDRVAAFRDAYRRLEAAERATPGEVPAAAAADVVSAARALGEEFSAYPDANDMASEAYLNRLAPFTKAFMAEGCALGCLILGLAAGPRWGPAFYRAGLAGHFTAIALETYGLLLRFRVLSRLPVATPLETMLWAALAASLLGPAFEILGRRRVSTLASSIVAVLALALAADAALLDPDFTVELPASHYNRWLAGHVAVIISGYGFLGFAMGLGLLATLLSLSDPLHRPPGLRRLATPLLWGLPIFGVGWSGITSASHSPWIDPAAPQLAAIGGFLAFAGGFALLGEVASRSRRTAIALGGVTLLLASYAEVAGLEYARALIPLGVVSTAMGLLPRRAPGSASPIEALAAVIDMAARVGVLLVLAGVIVGFAWARRSWDGHWLQGPKIAWTLATLPIYLVLIAGRRSGRIGPAGVGAASVMGFAVLLMAWLAMAPRARTDRHAYGPPAGSDVRLLTASVLVMTSAVAASSWRRMQGRASQRREPRVASPP